jgi:hypothetical protein
LVNSVFKLEDNGTKDKIHANILFTGLDHNPSRLKQMQLRVMNGKKTLFRDDLATGMGGRINMSFDLANKADTKRLTIIAQEILRTKKKRRR